MSWSYWKPPIELSEPEHSVLKLCNKRKIFIFVRLLRHLIVDEDLQDKLFAAYPVIARGKPAVHPAILTLAIILQAALDEPDHEVPVLTADSKRWQVVLGTLGQDHKAFSQSTLQAFRERMIQHDLDQVIFEKTIALAKESKLFAPKRIRAAFDSSPLYGAGRVQDTFNLIAQAAKALIDSVAKQQDLDPQKIAQRASAQLFYQGSIKSALDINWSDRAQQKEALNKVIDTAQALIDYLSAHFSQALQSPKATQHMDSLKKIIAQDTEPDPEGSGRILKKGTEKDRQISVHDPEMRHGRKSKSKRFDGYKRHTAVSLDKEPVVLACAVLPANRPDREAAPALMEQVQSQDQHLDELHIDRAYLNEASIEQARQSGLQVYSKPLTPQNGGRYTKTDFGVNFETDEVRCPAGVVVALPKGPRRTVRFPASSCGDCSQRSSCTRARSNRGRTVTLHPQEEFLRELSQQVQHPEGRAKLRERVVVEHAQAQMVNRRGDAKARYWGLRKNLFDHRRDAIVSNIQALARAEEIRLAA